MSQVQAGADRPEPLLVANDIVKVFGTGAGEVQVLKGVQLDLVPGELTLLMGPSGSGKTTLLSILGCILRQTEGDLSIAGQPTAETHRNSRPTPVRQQRGEHRGRSETFPP